MPTQGDVGDVLVGINPVDKLKERCPLWLECPNIEVHLFIVLASGPNDLSD